jgi:hypothetical protein
VEAAETCSACPLGYHQTSFGASYCLPCSPGEFGAVKGSIICQKCKIGYFTVNSTESSCTACAQGRYGTEEGLAFCLPCAAGKYEQEDGSCTSCPQGWSQASSHAKTCIECSLGQWTEGEKGSMSCVQCDLGKYANISERGTCVASPKGHYNDAKGQNVTSPCPENTYLEKAGAKTSLSCKACDHDRTTNTITGSTSNESCICRGQKNQSGIIHSGYYHTKEKQCEACPHGGMCSTDGASTVDLHAAIGFWRASNASAIFQSCTAAFRGVDQENIANKICCPSNSILCNVNDACLSPHTGPLCSLCSTDFVRVGTECRPCPGGASLGAGFGVAFALAVVCFLFSLVLLFKLTEKEKRKKNKIRGPFKIILTWCQILSALPSSTDSVPWPKSFISLSSLLGISNLDPFDVLGGNPCQFALRYLDKFLVHMMLPVLFAVAIWLAYGVAALKSSATPRHKLFRRMLAKKLMFVMLTLSYPGLATRIFTMFRAFSIDDIGEVLAADFGIAFHGEEHTAMMILAVGALLIYVIGIPLLVFILLFTNRRNLYSDKINPLKHTELKFELGTLYMQYDQQFYWWEVVVILHKMLMTGALVVIAPGSPVQILTGASIMLAYLLLVIRTAPYVEDTDDHLIVIVSVSILLVTLCGFVMMIDDYDRPYFKHATVEGFILTTTIISALLIGQIVYSVVRGKDPLVDKEETKSSTCIAHANANTNIDTSEMTLKYLGDIDTNNNAKTKKNVKVVPSRLLQEEEISVRKREQ